MGDLSLPMASIVLFQPWDRPADNSTAALPCWRIPALARDLTRDTLLCSLKGVIKTAMAAKCRIHRRNNNKDECGGVHQAIYLPQSDELGSTWGPVSASPETAQAASSTLPWRTLARVSCGPVRQRWIIRGSKHACEAARPRGLRGVRRGCSTARSVRCGAALASGWAAAQSVAPGRVLFAGYGGSPYSVGAWYSDDKGCTWASSRVGGCSACNMSAGHFVGDVSEQRARAARHRRVCSACESTASPSGAQPSVWTVDGVLTSTPPRGLRLPDGDGQHGLAAGDGGWLVFYSMTLSPKADRTHMAVLRSDDGGQTWPRGRLAPPRPIGLQRPGQS